MQLSSSSFSTSLAVQNARTRIFVPGSDPRFGSVSRASTADRFARRPSSAQTAFPNGRLFSPGLLDRLQTPLTRYTE
ncbi:MAG TPA: hypothetical protein VHO24_07505 [Opitutaceae bacterium]|nr:hypothetical protein [Opitutaceae bacterium]